MPAKRSKVTCIAEERHDLLAVISQGKAAAHKLTRARIRLQADQGPQGKPRQNIVYISAELSRLYPIGLTLHISMA